MVLVEEGGVTVEDSGSSNKSRLGRLVLQPGVRYSLQSGQQLRLGHLTATLIIEESQGNSDRQAPHHLPCNAN